MGSIDGLLPPPEEAQRLSSQLQAPERLRRHLKLVHDVAARLTESLAAGFPSLSVDAREVCLGAAIHDLGKTLHPLELFHPGRLHERDGPELLEGNGILPAIARFARTHGTWESEAVLLEDLLVALADNLWRGRRVEKLESRVQIEIATRTGQDQWEVFAQIDTIFETLATGCDERLRWQASGTD